MELIFSKEEIQELKTLDIRGGFFPQRVGTPTDSDCYHTFCNHLVCTVDEMCGHIDQGCSFSSCTHTGCWHVQIASCGLHLTCAAHPVCVN